MRRIILSLCIIFALSASPAYPFWIWTPKTGKWVNPKNLPKDSPKAQFDYAKGFYDEKKYDDAWADVHKAEAVGRTINPTFIKRLKDDSKRDK